MHRLLMGRFVMPLSLAGAIAIGGPPALAMTAMTAPAIEAALAEIENFGQARYSCRHRLFTSKRICSWRSNGLRWRWNRRRA